MSDEARRVYQRFGDFFLIVGGVFMVLGVVRLTLIPDLLRGNPTPVALLLLAIGGGLRWTVRERDDEDHPAEADGEEARAGTGQDRGAPLGVPPQEGWEASDDER